MLFSGPGTNFKEIFQVTYIFDVTKSVNVLDLAICRDLRLLEEM